MDRREGGDDAPGLAGVLFWLSQARKRAAGERESELLFGGCYNNGGVAKGGMACRIRW